MLAQELEVEGVSTQQREDLKAGVWDFELAEPSDFESVDL